MTEYGIFNDESEDRRAINALEADFYSREEAEEALRDRYADDEHAYVAVVEDDEQEEDEDE